MKRKRLRVTDERAVRWPLANGWRRQTIIRQLGPGDRIKGDVIYYAPCGKKLRTYPEVVRYIERRGITSVAREHFSYSAKMRIGEFLNPKPDGDGVRKTTTKSSYFPEFFLIFNVKEDVA